MPYGITQCYLPPGRCDIPALTPADAGTRLSDPGGLQGWVDLVGWLHTGWYTRAQTVTHPGTNGARCRVTSFIRQTTTPRRQVASVMTAICRIATSCHLANNVGSLDVPYTLQRAEKLSRFFGTSGQWRLSLSTNGATEPWPICGDIFSVKNLILKNVWFTTVLLL